MKRWKIFNKSSERMSEVADNSVNPIVTSPPFNDGLVYGNFLDKQPFDQYLDLMKSVIKECFRILVHDGIFIIETADTIISDGNFVQLAGLLQSFSLEKGFHLIARHINFIDTIGTIELPTHAGHSYFNPIEAAENHSNCCQWLVFSKANRSFEGGQISYISYQRPHSAEEHHCPFPAGIRRRFLEIGIFKIGDSVLDPFMGTGVLGIDVINKGGYYIGYEIDQAIFRLTERVFLSL